MNQVLQVLQTALPVFVMLGIGVLMRKKNLSTREGVNSLKNVAVNFTLPAVLFSAFATAQYDLKSIGIPVYMFAVCVLALVLGKVFCRMLGIGGRLSPFLTTGFEAGMLGYTLFSLLYPKDGASSFAIVDLGQVLFVFTLYKMLLNEGGSRKELVKEAISSPTIWAIAAGLLLGASGIMKALEPSGVSELLLSIASFIAAPTSALILLTIGYDLELKEMLNKSSMKLVALRLSVMAVVLAVTLVLNRFVFGGAMHTGALILMMILPPPYVLPVFTNVEEERSTVSSALSMLTAISLVLFAVMSALMPR